MTKRIYLNCASTLLHNVTVHLGPLNSVKKSAKSKNTVGGGMMVYSSFCGFSLYIKPEENLRSSLPLSSSIVHSSYRYCEDFAKNLPAISRPRGGFFHYFDFETDLPLSKTIAGRNFPVLRQFVQCPTRYGVFCSGKTLIQSRSILSC